MRLRGAVPFVLLALLVPAAPAAAVGTVSHTSGPYVLRYQGDAANDRFLYITKDASKLTFSTLPPANRSQFDAGPQQIVYEQLSCDHGNSGGNGSISCPFASLTRIELRGGDGQDYLALAEVPPTIEQPIPYLPNSIAVLIDGQEGNDFLLEGSRNVSINDEIRGGPGDDRLSDFEGNDSLFGEDGNDEFYIGDGLDTADGGPGADQVNFFFMPRPLTITMTRVEDATAPGGPQVDTLANMERIYGGDGHDQITGDDNANELHGGDGGNDRITGGGGTDNIQGAGGDDEIFARDGQIDVVDCGFGGTDTVHADTNDTVSNCETMDLSDELIPDADGDGSRKPDDCNDRDSAVKPGNQEVVDNGKDDDCRNGDAKDADRDGVSSDTDCADNDARRTPGKRDVRGNGVDENCDGRDAAASKVSSPIANRWGYTKTFTIVIELKIKSLVRGMTVKVKCKGRGCPKKSKTFKVKGNKPLDLKRGFFGRAKLKPGAVVEIQILRPEFHGKVVRYTIRADKLPSKKDMCLRIGARRPTRSC